MYTKNDSILLAIPACRSLIRLILSMCCISVYLPENTLPASAHLPLQLEHPVEECFSCRRAARHINIDGDNALM